MKKPVIAFFYSLFLPGLGQIYLREYAKGWVLLCMTGGVVVSLIINHSWFSWLLLGGVYLAIMIPAALDAFQSASGRPRLFAGDSVPYVIIMLLTVGPFAIPLLWQSKKFSRGKKIGWTIFVILVALLVIGVMSLMASLMETLMGGNAGSGF